MAAVRAEDGTVGALVFDLSTGKELYAVDPGAKRAPASVEKLWTTTALMDRLGPSATLQTAVLGTGSERHGVWHGNLYLRGGGDPTFGDAEFNRVWNGGQGTTAAQLAAQLRRKGIRRVTGKVYADESLFDRRRGGLMTDYKPDVPDFGGRLSALVYDHGTTAPHYNNPATFAAHEFALSLDADRISATASRADRTTPRRAVLLASVSSPPMHGDDAADGRALRRPVRGAVRQAARACCSAGGGTIAAGAHVISSDDRLRLRPAPVDPRRLGALAGRPDLAAGDRRPAARPVADPDRPRAVAGAADHGGQRHGRGHRRRHRGPGPLQRQDRVARPT